MLALDQVRKEGALISDIALGPLSREHLGALVGDALHCGAEDAAPLSDLVHEKTGGNPFFAIQFLTALHEERLIEFDEGAEAFRWDVAKIRGKGFTDNVVDLMVGKLVRLSRRPRGRCKQLACLGSTAEVALLATVRRAARSRSAHADPVGGRLGGARPAPPQLVQGSSMIGCRRRPIRSSPKASGRRCTSG